MSASAARAVEMKPTQLMQACGSRNGQWKPEAPEHWRWLLKNGEGPERALAWVKLNSIGRGSPFCVNGAGEALTVEHMAADCGWPVQTARNACSKLAGEGRIRLQRGKRIWYRADVPDTNGRTEGERKYSVQSIFPIYLTDFIQNLPETKKATLDEYAAWRKRFFADGMAALRRIDEQVQDSTLLAVGCSKRRLPKRRPVESKQVQLALVEAPEFLPEYSVQSINGDTLYKPENGAVQTAPAGADLNVAETFSRTEKSVGRSVDAASGQSGSAVPEPTDRHNPDSPLEIRELLIAEYGMRFPGEVPSLRLCRQIQAALGDAPLWMLRDRIRQRVKASSTMGFARLLARDTAEAWAVQQDKTAKEAARAEAARKREIEVGIGMARGFIADPAASADDREWALEYLGRHDPDEKSRGASGGGA